jgi:hypothetical protein
MAGESAKVVNAKAFTLGKNIVFGEREFEPETESGQRLLAHELTHVIQQRSAVPHGQSLSDDHILNATPQSRAIIQRKPGDKEAETTLPGASTPSQQKTAPPTSGETYTFEGMDLSESAEQVRFVLRAKMAKDGTASVSALPGRIENFLNTTVAGARQSKKDVEGGETLPGGVPWSDDELKKADALRDKILPVVKKEVEALNRDRESFINDFEKQAKADVSATLNTSEETAKREAVKYGLSEEQIWVKTGSRYGEEWGRNETRHHMRTGTPAVTGLQKVAEILLNRRQEIELLEREQRMATRFEKDPLDPKGQILVPVEPKFSDIGSQIQKEREKYKNIRSVVTGEYPVLAAVSELGESTGDLEMIAKKGAGDETARIISAQIAERLANIEKVRANLDDKSEVNIWRLPPVINVTGSQLGTDSDELKKRWVSEQIEVEKPGLLGSIALLIFNVLAIALAPATGGISLAVAAGVNVVATGFEVQEFMMKKALAGTTFDKAKALSQDDPSLFWLAFSIVGTVVDVAGAAGTLLKSFRALAPLAKTAEVAKEGKEAKEAMENLVQAARREGGAELATKVASNLKRARGGESIALEAAGATKAEREALETAATMTKREAADIIGRPVRTATSELKLTKSGRIVSCTNPCSMLRDKFEVVLAKDANLEKELAGLEKRAADAAEKAKIGGANAEEAAEAVKREATALEKKLEESAKKLVLADQLGKFDEIRKLFPKLESLDANAFERVLALAPNEGHIKGQLLEEFLNLRMAKSEAVAANVPANILKQVEKEGGKLEFIPGYAIRDAEGDLVSDGIIGYWKGDRFNIVTFFESKGGAASGRGLRRKWTGVPKAERAEIMKEVQGRGIVAYRELDQNAAEALSEAVEKLRKANPKKYSGYTIDEVLKEFPGDVEKAWAKLPQSEAGQVRKTTERLVPNAGQSFTNLEILGKPKPVKVTTGGGTPHAVGVLPTDVAEKSLEQTMKEGGIKSFERLKDVPVDQAELNRMAAEIARVSGMTKPKKL